MYQEPFPGAPPQMQMPFGSFGSAAMSVAQVSGFAPVTDPLLWGGMNTMQAYNSERFFNDVQASVSQASTYQAAYVANGFNNALMSAGIQPTPEVQQSIAGFAGVAGPLLSGLAVQSPMGRTVLDAMAPNQMSPAVLAAGITSYGRSAFSGLTGGFGMTGAETAAIGEAMGQTFASGNYGSATGQDIVNNLFAMRQLGMSPMGGTIDDAFSNTGYMAQINSPEYQAAVMSGQTSDPMASAIYALRDPSLVDPVTGEDRRVNNLDDLRRHRTRIGNQIANVEAEYGLRVRAAADESRATLDTLGKKVAGTSAEDLISKLESEDPATQAKKALLLASAVGGEYASSSMENAEMYAEATQALLDGNMDAFNQTTIGKAIANDGGIMVRDRILADVGSTGVGVSPEVLKRMLAATTEGELSGMGQVNREDLFGINAATQRAEGLAGIEGNEVDATIIKAQAAEAAKRASEIAEVTSAMKDLLHSDGYRKFTSQFGSDVQAMNALVGGGTHQMTYDQVRGLARHMEAMSDMTGMDAQQMSSMMQTAQGIGQQYGMAAAMTPELAMTGGHYLNAFNNLPFDPVYGGASAAQLATQRVNLQARGMRSEVGTNRGLIVAMRDSIESAGSAEARQLQAALAAFDAGDTSALDEYANMSGNELMSFLERGSNSSGRAIENVRKNERMIEEAYFNNRGLAAANAVDQQNDMRNLIGAAAEEGLMGSFDGAGMSATERQRARQRVSEIAVEVGMSSGGYDVDQVAARLEEEARNDPALAQALAAGGGASNLAFTVQAGIEANSNFDGGPASDLFKQFGDPAMRAAAASRARADTLAFIYDGDRTSREAGMIGVIGNIMSGEAGAMDVWENLGKFMGVDFTGERRSEFAQYAQGRMGTILNDVAEKRKRIMESGLSGEARTEALDALEQEASAQLRSLRETLGTKAGEMGVQTQARKDIEAQAKGGESTGEPKPGETAGAGLGSGSVGSLVVNINDGEVVISGKGGTYEIPTDGSAETAGTV